MTFFRIVLFLVCASLSQYLMLRSVGQYYAEAYNYDAQQLNNHNRYAQAEQAARSAARHDPLNGYAQYHIANSLYLMDRYEPAATEATKGLPYMPHRAQMLRLRGECYHQLHKYDEAGKDLLTFLSLTPQPPINPAHLMLVAAQALMRTGRAGEAEFWLNRAASEKPPLGDAIAQRAEAALLLQDPPAAANAICTLLSRRGEERLNAPALIKAAFSSNRVPALVEALQMALSSFPDSPLLTKTLGATYLRAQDPAGIAFLKSASEQFADDSELHFMLGDLYFRRREFPAAEEQFNRVLTLQPDSPYTVEIERRRSDMR